MAIGEEINQSEFENSQRKSQINLLFTANWLQSKMKSCVKPFGITSQQYNVLRILKGRYPQPCSAGEIKKVMVDKSPDLTRLIDRLVAKKYVIRFYSEENRRKLKIEITKTGLQLIEEMNPSLQKFLGELNKISNEEAEELSRILDKMRD